MPILLKQQNPKNVGVGWSQACGFWRPSAAICPVRLSILSSVANNIYIGVSGGWWSGVIGVNCGASNSYVSATSAQVLIDVWKALADGLWSSSVVFSVYTTVGTVNEVIYAATNGASSPAQQDLLTSNMGQNTGACPSVLKRTVTVYDDGTFTLA